MPVIAAQTFVFIYTSENSDSLSGFLKYTWPAPWEKMQNASRAELL